MDEWKNGMMEPTVFTGDCLLLTAYCRLATADWRLPTANFFLIPHAFFCQLPPSLCKKIDCRLRMNNFTT